MISSLVQIYRICDLTTDIVHSEFLQVVKKYIPAKLRFIGYAGIWCFGTYGPVIPSNTNINYCQLELYFPCNEETNKIFTNIKDKSTKYITPPDQSKTYNLYILRKKEGFEEFASIMKNKYPNKLENMITIYGNDDYYLYDDLSDYVDNTLDRIKDDEHGFKYNKDFLVETIESFNHKDDAMLRRESFQTNNEVVFIYILEMKTRILCHQLMFHGSSITNGNTFSSIFPLGGFL